MRKAPGFTATALAALALGIGATTSIFFVVNAVFLKPLTFPDPDRIVFFFLTSPTGPTYGGSATRFNIWREQTQVLQDVSAYEYAGTNLNLTGEAFPEQVHTIRVSADYFRLFGAPLIQGRSFTSDEDRPNGGHAAVLSYGLWQRHFGGDPNMVGRTISLSGVPYVVVGIVGAGFNTELDTPPEIWLPFQIDPASADHAQYFTVVARLKPGATLAMANAHLQLAADEFRRKFPNMMGPRDGYSVQPLPEAIVSEVRSSLLILAGAVSFMLLIACANVANLLLVRATGRRREIAIRTAVGASRGRIIRQLLTESVVLSSIGGALGLALGYLGIRALMSVNTAGLPRVGEDGALIGIDWRVLLFTLAVSVTTGILFGLIPALQGSRTELNTALKDSSSRSGTGFRQNKTRSILVVVEMALAVVLLVGSALLIRTSIALQSVDPGYNTSNVITMRMSLTGPKYLKSMGVEQILRDGVDRIRAIPGVIDATATCCVPLQGGYGLGFQIVGRPLTDGQYHGGGEWITTSPGFL